MKTYYVKNIVRLRGTFTDLDTGQLVNPSTDVIITVQRDGQTAKSVYQYTLAQVTKTADGIYDLFWDSTARTPGLYNYEVWGTGTNQALGCGQFQLNPSLVV